MRVTSAGVAGVLLAFFGGLAAWAGCVDLDSLQNGPPRTDGGLDARDTGPTIPDPCEHAREPAAPDHDDAPDVSLDPFEVALESVVLDSSAVAGYDLDGLCTCDKRPGAPAAGSCAGKKDACDLDRGVDNAAGVVALGFKDIVRIDKLPNRLLSTGRRGLLLQIRSYNGRANDGKVTVGTIPSEGIRAQGCATSTPDVASGTYTPGGCGDDAWSTAPDTVVSTGGVNVPLSKSDTAYVTKGQLVARFKDPVRLPFTEARTVDFHDGVLTATIVPLGEDLKPRDTAREPTAKEKRLFRLENGVLAGRVDAKELLQAIGSYTSATQGTVCKSPAYGEIRGQLCDALDLSLAPPSTTAPRCDAISAAFGFAAGPAKADALANVSAPADPCADVDPTIFACP